MIEFVGDKHDGIGVIRDIIPRGVCDDIIYNCLNDFSLLFHDGPTLAGVNKRVKNTYDFNFSGEMAGGLGADYQTYKALEMRVHRSLWAAISMYIESFPELMQAPPMFDTGFRLQRYIKETGYYRSHVDGAPWDPEPTCQRILGGVIYLNTIERGGETSFPMHGLKVKPEAGAILLFPSNWTHPHAAQVPISDDKWMISTFIMSHRREPFMHEPASQVVSVIDTNSDPKTEDGKSQ